MRIAVIGAGVAGISASWLLSPIHHVDVYEAEGRLGGHTCTIDVDCGAGPFPVDTGFQVFNRRTYPNLTRFFRELGIDAADADMSFSVQVRDADIEWSGTPGHRVRPAQEHGEPQVPADAHGRRPPLARRRQAARRPDGRRAHTRTAHAQRGLLGRLHRLVPDPDGRRDLVDPARRHARLPGAHVPALLRQPRTAAHPGQADVAVGARGRAPLRRGRVAKLLGRGLRGRARREGRAHRHRRARAYRAAHARL